MNQKSGIRSHKRYEIILEANHVLSEIPKAVQPVENIGCAYDLSCCKGKERHERVSPRSFLVCAATSLPLAPYNECLGMHGPEMDADKGVASAGRLSPGLLAPARGLGGLP